MKRQLLNKCECCGALFEGDTCEYCKARYHFEEEKEVKQEDKPKLQVISNCIESGRITLRLGDKENDFYVASYGYESFSCDMIEPRMEVRLISYGRWREVEDGSTKEDKRSDKHTKRVGRLRKRTSE